MTAPLPSLHQCLADMAVPAEWRPAAMAGFLRWLQAREELTDAEIARLADYNREAS